MAVITISRQYGVEGAFFGKELAKALNYKYVDKDIYKKVAEKENISINDLEALESITGLGIDFFQKLIDSEYIKKIIGKKYLSFEHNDIVSAIENSIKEFASLNNIVIIGRGSQCILKDYPDTYHIKIVKNFSDRVNTLVKRGISLEGAKSTLNRKDKEREGYIKKFYNVNWNNPDLYHLIINLSKVSLDKGILIVKSLIH